MTKERAAKAIGILAAVCIVGSASIATAAPRGDGGRSDGPAMKAPRDGGARGDRGGNFAARDGGKMGIDAEARRGRDRGDWKGPGYKDRIRRGHRYSWGPGIAFYFADGYYYGECQWVKRRAIETGSRTWWRRYERCRDFN